MKHVHARIDLDLVAETAGKNLNKDRVSKSEITLSLFFMNVAF